MLNFDTGIRTGQKTILNETEQKYKYVCRNGNYGKNYEQNQIIVRYRATDDTGTNVTEKKKNQFFRNSRRGANDGKTSVDKTIFVNGTAKPTVSRTWKRESMYRAVAFLQRQYGVVIRRHASAFKIPSVWKHRARSVSQW